MRSTLVKTLWLICSYTLIGCVASGEIVEQQEPTPTANITAPASVEVGQEVVLNGAYSFDPNDRDLSYSWSLQAPDESQSVLFEQTAQLSGFIPDVEGDYVIQLVVSNGTHDSEPTLHTLTANPPSSPKPPTNHREPIADAGQNQTIAVGTTIILSGLNSYSPEGLDLSFEWTLLNYPEDSDAELIDSDTPAPSFTPDKTGTYAIQLVVNDGYVDSEPAILGIRAIEDSDIREPPVAIAGDDQSVEAGTEVFLDGSNSYDERDLEITYHWRFVSLPASTHTELVDADTATPSFMADVAGDYTIELVVKNDVFSSEPDTITVTASPSHASMVPTANAGDDRTHTQWFHNPQPVVLDAAQSDDADLGPLTYQWSFISKPAESNTIIVDETRQQAQFTPDVEGDYQVQLIVTNSVAQSEPVNVTISVDIRYRPIANAGSDQEVEVGELVILDGTGSYDPEDSNAPLSYLWEFVSRPSGSQAELNDSSASNPTFTPDLEGDYRLVLTVQSPNFNSVPDQVIISAVPPEISISAPTANAGSAQVGAVRTTITLDASASSDPQDLPLSYSWSLVQKPADSQVTLTNPTTLAPQLTLDRTGNYELSLIVDNGHEQSLPATVTIIAIEAQAPHDHCLIISEYAEGSSNNKAVELFNCGDSAINLSHYGICFIMNGETECTGAGQRVAMLNGTLMPDETYGICNPGIDDTLLPYPEACDLFTGKASFNGDDRIAIFFDNDNNQGYSANNTIVDAFGQLSNVPLSLIWSDKTYRRCDWTPYLGASSFTLSNYFSTHESDDFSDFGLAPEYDVCSFDGPPPTANAGGDNTAIVGTPYQLDASASQNPADTTLTYSWRILFKPTDSNATLTNSTSITPTFIPDVSGIYRIELEVNNGFATSTPDNITLYALVDEECLIISEYIEGTGNNKALELYNCGTPAIDLTEIGVCVIQNDETSCTNDPSRLVLLDGILASHHVMGICHDQLDTGLLESPQSCAIQTNSLTFNGDDRIIVFKDDDSSGDFSATDTILDAFGRTNTRPSQDTWQDITLRRCNWNYYDGTGLFDYYSMFVSHPVNDLATFGQLPNAHTCFVTGD